MKVQFFEEAQSELDQTIEYSNLESKGLGKQFVQEIINALDRIASFPKHFPIILDDAN